MATYKIIGARNDENGKLNEFLLDSGNWISLNEAIEFSSRNELEAVVIKSAKSPTYLRSKPDSTKDNNFDKLAKLYEPYLLFNGFELCWMENEQKIDCWQARSGREGYQSPVYQSLVDKGPIPEGEWYVRQDRYQRKPPVGADWIEDLKNSLGGGACLVVKKLGVEIEFG